MRTTSYMSVHLRGQIKVNSAPVKAIEESFQNIGDARKFLSRLTYNGQKVKLKGAKIGEFYFSGELYKQKSNDIITIDKF